MNPVIVFYLIISAAHCAPLVVITLGLQFDAPIHFFPQMLHGRVNHGLHRTGISRFEEFSQALDSDTKEYMTKFSLAACLFQLLTMALIVIAIMFDVPLPFLSNIDDKLTMDVMNELLMFGALVTSMQVIPMVCFSLALFFEIRLPCMSAPSENRAPPSNDIELRGGNSQEPASIRLTHVEDSENIFLYANCHDERLGKLFKIVVRQGKEAGARPQCFLYESTLEQIHLAPIGVNQLNQNFIQGDDEVAV